MLLMSIGSVGTETGPTEGATLLAATIASLLTGAQQFPLKQNVAEFREETAASDASLFQC